MPLQTEPTSVGMYVEIPSGKRKTKDCSYVNSSFDGIIVLTCTDAVLTADTDDCTPVGFETKIEKVFKHTDLPSVYTQSGLTGLTAEQMAAARTKIKAINKKMAAIRALSKAKNDVEAHIFGTRDNLEYDKDLVACLSTEDADIIRAGLSEAEEWMWEDGLDLSAYTEKLYALRDAIKPAQLRKEESKARPTVVSSAKEKLVAAEEYLADTEKIALTPANETEKLTAAKAEFGGWLAEQEAAQEGKALTEEPAFMSSEVASKLSKFSKLFTAVKKSAKKPKKAKKNKKPKTDGDEEESEEEYAEDSEESEEPLEETEPATDLYELSEEEQVAVLKVFYDKHSAKDDEAILAILAKRKVAGEEEVKLPSAGFKTLCGKLEKLYKESPITLHAEKVAAEAAAAAEEAGEEEEAEESKEDL